MQRRIGDILRNAGYEIQTLSSDPGALDQSSAATDLIVLGTHAAGRKERGKWMDGSVPVLALCEVADGCADAYLPPPFSAQDLLSAVKLLLVLATDQAFGSHETIVDVGAVLELALQRASAELAGRAHVTREFDTQLRVRANAEQLCSIFLNLLLTAASRMEREAPEANGIRVAGWRTADGRTIVEISDTGHGIPAAELASLFDADIGRATRPAEGLDLPASQRVMEARGGAITVTSKLSGTSFRVELPTAEKSVAGSPCIDIGSNEELTTINQLS
jgi:signal transduction histidine kinase